MEDEWAARILAMRDIVIRLLAYQALNSSDAIGLLKEFSDATDAKIYDTANNLSQEDNDGTMGFQELIRDETDAAIQESRVIVAKTLGIA